MNEIRVGSVSIVLGALSGAFIFLAFGASPAFAADILQYEYTLPSGTLTQTVTIENDRYRIEWGGPDAVVKSNPITNHQRVITIYHDDTETIYSLFPDKKTHTETKLTEAVQDKQTTLLEQKLKEAKNPKQRALLEQFLKGKSSAALGRMLVKRKYTKRASGVRVGKFTCDEYEVSVEIPSYAPTQQPRSSRLCFASAEQLGLDKQQLKNFQMFTKSLGTRDSNQPDGFSIRTLSEGEIKSIELKSISKNQAPIGAFEIPY